jgi:hypothetical protein
LLAVVFDHFWTFAMQEPHEKDLVNLKRSEWRVDETPNEDQPILLEGGGFFILKTIASILFGLWLSRLIHGWMSGL